MYEKIRDQYDSLYSSQTNVFGEGKPVAVVQKLTNYVTSGEVLDIGGGEGRNALYLAEQGFSVSVYDISAVAMERLNSVAKERDLTMKTKVADVTTEGITDSFDVVLITFVLHHVNEQDALRLIQEAQKQTRVGGVHVISTFANSGALFKRNQHASRFYPSKQTFQDLYKDWKIAELSVEETLTHARDKEGNRMSNDVLSLIAINEGVL